MSSWIGCFSNPVGYSRNLLCDDPPLLVQFPLRRESPRLEGDGSASAKIECVKANIESSILGHKLAAFFADAMDRHLTGFRIRPCDGVGYRMSLTCSGDKLQRNFEGPTRHLVVTIYHEKRGRKVWVRRHRLFFFQPWTKIQIRLECSTNQYLLEQAKQIRFRRQR